MINNKSINIFKLVSSIFLINSIIFILFFELYLYQDYSFIKCSSLNCFYKNFKFVHIYYLIVYFFLAVTCGFLINYFKLLGSNVKNLFKWMLFLFFIFLMGFSLFAINKYYWGIWWKSYSFFEWIANVFYEYIYAMLVLYFKQVLLFVTTTILIIWRFIKLNSNEN